MHVGSPGGGTLGPHRPMFRPLTADCRVWASPVNRAPQDLLGCVQVVFAVRPKYAVAANTPTAQVLAHDISVGNTRTFCVCFIAQVGVWLCLGVRIWTVKCTTLLGHVSHRAFQNVAQVPGGGGSLG